MRKPQASSTANAQFRCPAEAVWRVLQSAERYKDWFGYPEPLECTFIDPSFSPGARLQFKNDPTTKIITAFEPNRRLALADDISREQIEIEPNEAGCLVALSVYSYEKNPPSVAALERRAEAMLRALKALAYDEAELIVKERGEQPKSEKGSWLFSGVRGYKKPVIERGGSEQSAAQLIDNTESDIALPRRALGVVLVFAVLLFAVLGVGMRFERSDIVPSSGLSLTESEFVNRAQAELVDISMTKNALERHLSCQGLRLDTETYYYCSVEQLPDGTPREQMYVTYDAFGNIRRYAYIDQAAARARLALPVGVLGGIGGNEFADPNSYLSSSMVLEEVEQLVGANLSAFVVDKSGVETLFFGRVNEQLELFDAHANAQFVVKLDRAANSTSARYYETYSPLNPLPFSLEGSLNRQYSQRGEYLQDRAAFERAFMIVGLVREQVDILLATEGVEYERDETAGTSSVSYSVRNPAAESAGYSYEYLVSFKDGVAVNAAMTNQRLRALRQIGPSADQAAALEDGMTLFETYAVVDMLPSAMRMSVDGLALFYGSDENQNYPLAVGFDHTRRIISIQTDLLNEGAL